MPTDEVRVPDEEKISKVNLAIIGFFSGRMKNRQRTEWFSPYQNGLLIPRELREITESLFAFFLDKKWYCGGPIPDELLYTRRNYHLINNISLIEAIDKAYQEVLRQKTLAKTPYGKGVDIVITMNVLRQCEKRSIPQDHIGGLLLLYLELCEKIELL